jgi:hypothetical protein
MPRKKNDASRIKSFILLVIIVVWGLLSGVIFYFSSTFLDDQYPSRRNPFIFEQKVTCDDIELVFPQNTPGICFDDTSGVLRVTVRPMGDAHVTSLLITIIGEDGGEILEERSHFDDEYYTIQVPYDTNEDGDVELVEIVPRYVDTGIEQHCEESKVTITTIPACEY